MNELQLHIATPGSFYGVYILYNVNPKYKGDIYIGFTVNPERRIRQHNREIEGGAMKTGRNRGPWDMVLITHGFRTRLSALQFEWAWQNPLKSRRLSHITKKSSKENKFTYRLRILNEMLNTGPWCRLSLTIQWLKQEYCQKFAIEKQPPLHMPIAYGEIRTVKLKNSIQEMNKNTENLDQAINESSDVCIKRMCCICHMESEVSDTLLCCIVLNCKHTAHKKCLAELFLKQQNENKHFIIPIFGVCPSCRQNVLWSDLIKQTKYNMSEDEDTETLNDQSSSDQDLD